LPSVIRTVATQGMVLGLIPLLLESRFNWFVALLAFLTVP
jgi:hydrogenase-4 component E